MEAAGSAIREAPLKSWARRRPSEPPERGRDVLGEPGGDDEEAPMEGVAEDTGRLPKTKTISRTSQSGSREFASTPAPLFLRYRNGIAASSLSDLMERESAKKFSVW
jgi:hypothetical protein